ncbi:carbohydrate kinase family protein [Subtercola endophyticus]|uniref:carbohydrate kinase family protein n=1 Tax=Subtercola endophyticus TaxID=2895559 RepID=UPI001E5495EA|nr:PfkB family carbohydrate kinase [Subtercola endophyticus]UFS60103.1 PfkB family carbohydrate kinase [Subtercola endophyticus]
MPDDSRPPSAPHLPVRVVVIGDIFDDVIVTPSGPVRTDTDTLAAIERRPGGSAANTAAWLGSLGTQVDFVGRTNLVDTARHETALRNSGVTPHLLGESILPTGTIVVIVERAVGANGEATIDTRTMLTERGANALTSPDDVTDSLLRVATHLHFTGYTIFSGQPRDGFVRLIERARMHDVTVSIDPASAGFIADHGASVFLDTVSGVDILFPNFDEAVALTGLTLAPGAAPAESPAATALQLVNALTEHFPVVALTLGRAGAVVAAGAPGSPNPIRHVVECVPVEPRDTTGAGDAFNAGFLSGLFEGTHAGDHALSPGDGLSARLLRAATQGVEAAARAIENVGARPVGVKTHHHGLNTP